MSNQPDAGLLAKIPLRAVLILPFVTLTVLAVGLVGFLSYRNGQQAVNEVAHQLRAEITAHIENYVDTFLDTPHRINQLNADAIGHGLPAANDPAALERYLWQQIQNFDTVSSIYFGNTAGGLVDAGREGAQGSLYIIATEGFKQGQLGKFATDEKGHRTDLLVTVPKFDARTRPWYTAALHKNGPAWSEVYILSTGQDLAVAASRPVYDEHQNLLGVVSVDIFLSHLSDFLKSLTIGKTGQSFIMDHSGLLIASSIDEKPFNASDGKSAPQRLPANESASPLIKAAAQTLTQHLNDHNQVMAEQQLEFELAGQRHFVNVAPVQTQEGIDWLIVVVIPEADFMAQIKANSQSTVILSNLALLLTLIFGFIATGWIARPISRLKVAAQNLAKGEWQPVASRSRIDEIGDLTHSFNHMAAQLYQMVNSLTAEVAARQQAEATLHDQLEFVRTLLETIPNPVFYKDRVGRYTGCNRAFEEFMGRSREEIMGKTVQALGPRHIAAKYEEMDQALWANPGTQTYEWRVLTGSGEERSVIFNKAATTDTAGNITGLVGIITDITERKQMEVRQQELLAEREQLVQRLQLILERMPIGCILSDRDFKITYWNPAAERIFGHTAAEALGQLPHQLLISPEVRPYVEQIQARMRQGDMNAHSENENLTKDGRTIICQWHNIPLVNVDGTIVGNLGMVQDITERKAGEETLRRYERIVSATPDLMSLINRDYVYLIVNQAYLSVTGKSYQQIVGHTIAQVMGDGIFQTNKPYLDRALAGETVQFEKWLDYPVAGRRFVSQTYTPYIETDGTITGLVVSRRDLTNLKLLEERLGEAQKMEAVGQLAAGMAHHYNSMLTAIIGFTSLSLRKLPPGDPIAKNLERVLSTAERAAVLIRQLLAFAGKQLLQPQTINLNELVLNLKDELKRLLTGSIELRLNLAPDLELVHIDPSQFMHLLFSLTTNAYDVMPGGGCLTLTTANVNLDPAEADLYQLTTGPYVLLTVQDTGPGLTDDIKAHLFEPFFTTKDVGQGTGLGLSMSLGIARQHGGQLLAESQPGQGATFKVYLPRVMLPASPLTQPAAASLPQTTETILLIETEPAVRELVAQVLSQQGYTVLKATDGEAALQFVADQTNHAPQLLLANLVMPGLSGYPLIDRFRASYPNLKALFFIETTAEQIPEADRPGISFLRKPFKPSILSQQVRAILDAGATANG